MVHDLRQLIDWPTNLCDTGEGGMWVYAFVHEMDGSDPLVRCASVGHTIALPAPDVVVGEVNIRSSFQESASTRFATQTYRAVPDRADERDEWYTNAAARPVLAATLLGSSNGSWYDHNADLYWVCGVNDLTAVGREFVDGLIQVYDRPVRLVTFLDT